MSVYKQMFFWGMWPVMILFLGCNNKTKNFLVKKWDCVQVENLAPVGNNAITPQDSAIAMQTEAALKALNWTFSTNNTYQCSIGDKITTQGTYEISADEKILTLTPSSKNITNIYGITTITENELTLTSTGTNVPLILHFRPH